MPWQMSTIWFRSQCVNSSPPSAAYMYMSQCTGPDTDSGNGLSHVRRQAIIWTNAALLSIGAVGTKLWIKMQTFHSWKCTWKCRSRNDGHCVLGEMTTSESKCQRVIVGSLMSEWLLFHQGRPHIAGTCAADNGVPTGVCLVSGLSRAVRDMMSNYCTWVILKNVRSMRLSQNEYSNQHQIYDLTIDKLFCGFHSYFQA